MTEASVLVVVAHPDDESLGCGGAIAKLARSGAKVRALIMSAGRTKNAGNQAIAAAKILGLAEIQINDFTDQQLDNLPLAYLAEPVEAAIALFQPQIVFTHSGSDLNQDHRAVFQATAIACRPVPKSTVESLYSCEIPSSSEWGQQPFAPNTFYDISEFLEIKQRALDCYVDEMRPFPHPRSQEAVAALAKVRGVSCGVAAAEAFYLVRRLIK